MERTSQNVSRGSVLRRNDIRCIGKVVPREWGCGVETEGSVCVVETEVSVFSIILDGGGVQVADATATYATVRSEI